MADELTNLSSRDQMMRRMAREMTPEERMAKARSLQEWSMQQLRCNPEAWDRFLRRNLRQRAIKPHGSSYLARVNNRCT